MNFCALNFNANDFRATDFFFNDKKGKRMFLTRTCLNEFLNRLHDYFGTQVTVPRRNRGAKQEIESLISEEAMILAEYLRDERDSWVPRIADP